MKQSLSLSVCILALACLSVSVTAADRPLEGRPESFLGEPKFEVQQISKSGERGIQANGVMARDGTVLVTWHQPGDVFKAKDGKNVRIRRSEDGGQTWGDEIVIAEGFTGGGTTVDETTGDILAFVEDCHPPAPLTVYRSKDQGKTWKAQETVIKPDSKGIVPSMHMAEHGITLQHGKHKGRLLRPARHYAGTNHKGPAWLQHYNTAIYSDDGGKSWLTSEPFPLLGTGEGGVAEMSDGRIYYNSRRHAGPPDEPVDQVRRRWSAWSSDGGATWKNLASCKQLPDGPQNSDYGCHAGLVRLPFAGRDILLYSNSDNPKREIKPGDDPFYGNEADSRIRGTVWVSFDGGASWPLKRLVNEGRFSYSSLAAGRPGTPSDGWIYCYWDVHSGKEPIRMARFNLAWLLQGEPTGDGYIPKITTLTTPGAATGDQSPPEGEVNVFVSGKEGHHTYRVPSLLTTQKGTLLAFCEGRTRVGYDHGDIDMVLKRSVDGGKTWGPMQMVWDDAENTCGNACPVVDEKTGTISLLLTWNRSEDHEGKIMAGTSKDVRRPYISRSTDDGLTWSKPIDLSETCRDPDWDWYATGPGVAIQLKRGKHKGRLVCPANHSSRKYEDHPYASHVIYSDDGGQTWQRSGVIRPGCNESQVVELADGTLMMNMRSYAPRGHRAIATSTDGGQTWSKIWHHLELPEPTCQASFLRYSTVDDGGRSRLLFSNPPTQRYSQGSALDYRDHLTVRLSYDEGQTWPVSRLICAGHSAYSCLTVLPDKSIGLLYDRDHHAKVTFARFTLDWLSRGKDQQGVGR